MQKSIMNEINREPQAIEHFEQKLTDPVMRCLRRLRCLHRFGIKAQ